MHNAHTKKSVKIDIIVVNDAVCRLLAGRIYKVGLQSTRNDFKMLCSLIFYNSRRGPGKCDGRSAVNLMRCCS